MGTLQQKKKVDFRGGGKWFLVLRPSPPKHQKMVFQLCPFRPFDARTGRWPSLRQPPKVLKLNSGPVLKVCFFKKRRKGKNCPIGAALLQGAWAAAALERKPSPNRAGGIAGPLQHYSPKNGPRRATAGQGPPAGDGVRGPYRSSAVGGQRRSRGQARGGAGVVLGRRGDGAGRGRGQAGWAGRGEGKGRTPRTANLTKLKNVHKYKCTQNTHFVHINECKKCMQILIYKN